MVPSDPTQLEPIRMGKRSSLWAQFTPSGGALTVYSLQIASHSRGGKTEGVVVDASFTKCLAELRVGQEHYPLPIHWYAPRRGGGLLLGGARKTSVCLTELTWEMEWVPVPGVEDGFRIQLKVQLDAGKRGDLVLQLPSPMLISDTTASAAYGVSTHLIWSQYSSRAIALIHRSDSHTSGEWQADAHAFRLVYKGFPLGGGKSLRATAIFSAAGAFSGAAQAMTHAFARIIPTYMAAPPALPVLHPAHVADWLTHPANVRSVGAQRLYVAPPDWNVPQDALYAGMPFYPMEALVHGWMWNALHDTDCMRRVVRFGALGLAADFQVMGSLDGVEPNKGAFWDLKYADGSMASADGSPRHRVDANGRIAVALFRLAELLDEGLCRHSALNVCQWLLLKLDSNGSYPSRAICATQGTRQDGKPSDDPYVAEGVEALSAFVYAFRLTQKDVWMKAAWRIALNIIGTTSSRTSTLSAHQVARIVLALATLNKEAANPRLEDALSQYGMSLLAHVWSRPQLETTDSSEASPTLGWREDLARAESAQALLWLSTATKQPEFAAGAVHALCGCSESFSRASWPALMVWRTLMLSLAHPYRGAVIDFDMMTVELHKRVFEPDSDVTPYVSVTAPDMPDGWPMSLTLVCRATEQMLLLVLAPLGTPLVALRQNGRGCVARDLVTEEDTDTLALHPAPGQWAAMGVWIITP